jgi:hypothetical protein
VLVGVVVSDCARVDVIVVSVPDMVVTTAVYAAVGSKPFVHAIVAPALLGRLAYAVREVPPLYKVDWQYGSQLESGSRSSSVEFAGALQPPHMVSSLSVPPGHWCIATHSCSLNSVDFQAHAGSLKPGSVHPAIYVFPALLSC